MRSTVVCVQYSSEELLQGVIDLISLDLSEPYSIFTYRYFINNWPQLCYLAVIPPQPTHATNSDDTASAEAAPADTASSDATPVDAAPTHDPAGAAPAKTEDKPAVTKARDVPTVVGAIVCKQDTHRSGAVRGYIAMLAVSSCVRPRP